MTSFAPFFLLMKYPLSLYLRLLWPFWHSLVVAGSFLLTYHLRLVTDLIPGLQLRVPPIDTVELLLFALVSVVLFFVLGLFLRSYHFQFSLEYRQRTFFTQWFFWVVAMTFVAYFGHGFIFSSGISRFILFWSAFFSGVIISGLNVLYRLVLERIEQKSPVQVLCVGTSSDAFAALDPAWGSSFVVRYILAGEWNDIDYDAYEIVVVVGDFPKEKLQAEYDAIRLAHHTMYHIADGQFLDDVVYTPVRMGGINAYRYMPTRLNDRMRIIKRIVDISGAFLGLLVLFPLLLCIALAIKIDSSGSIFYEQKRIGRNGAPFVIRKFRTMFTHLSVGEKYGGSDARQYKKELMNSDANVRKGELQKIDKDPRVTRVGSFLRRTSLDELPSLWNVLVGEMSLVGPRPHEGFEVERYKSRQRRLLSMKPGITGYAQINGRDALSFDEEAQFDLYYMQHWSFWFDFYILVMTLKVVLKGR